MNVNVKYFTLGSVWILFLLSYHITVGQNQPKADSLKQWIRNAQPDSAYFENLRSIAVFETNPDSVIFYAKRLIREAVISSDSIRYIQVAHVRIGSAYINKGHVDKALEHLFVSAQYADTYGMKTELSDSYGEISNAYMKVEDFVKAIHFQKVSIDVLDDENALVTGLSYLNLGYQFYLSGKYDSAIISFQMARPIISRHSNSAIYLAYLDGNRALVEAASGQYSEATKSIYNSIEVLEGYGDDLAISDFSAQLGSIYLAQGRYKQAVEMAKEGLRIATENGYRDLIKMAFDVLSKAAYELGDYRQAYQYQADYYAYRDSIINTDLIRQLADQQTDFEVSQKQKEVELKEAEVEILEAEKKTREIFLISVAAFACILVVLAVVILKFYQSKAKVNKVLEKQKQELQSLNEAKDKFFSIISHDLRGPVASFYGISRMIKFFVKSKATDSLIEIADDIDDSVSNLSGLLDNLLNWATQQRGQIPHIPEKIVLRAMVDDLAKTLGNMAKGKNIEIKVDIDDAICLWSDQNTTMTILRNLVNNSLKFTPEGGRITITAEEKADKVLISVSDTGVGINNEKLKKLFKLTGERSTYGTDGEKGLGLGLQLVKEFVELNNGEIDVQSEEGKGTTFRILLRSFEQIKTDEITAVNGS